MISDLFGPETFFGHRLGGDFFFYRVASSSFHSIGTNTCNFIVIEWGPFFLEFFEKFQLLDIHSCFTSRKSAITQFDNKKQKQKMKNRSFSLAIFISSLQPILRKLVLILIRNLAPFHTSCPFFYLLQIFCKQGREIGTLC